MKTQTRIPRPLGTTELGNIYNKDKDTNNLNHLQEHIIHSYINSNYKYCQQPMTIEDLCMYLNIDHTKVNKVIYDKAKIHYSLLEEDGQKELLASVGGHLLNSSLSDRSMALQHLNVLLQAQGNAYKPFISSEVTRALNTTIASTQSLAQIAKMFLPTQGTMVQINNHLNNQQQTNLLTVESALELIDSKGTVPLLSDPNTIEDLYLEHNIGDMPEVQANNQQGFDTSKEGINFAKADSTHIDRRADSMGIDIEADEV